MAYIDQLFHVLIQEGGSDLHLAEGQPPKIRRHGEIHPISDEPLTHEQMSYMLSEICSPSRWERFNEVGDLDFAYEMDAENRFRCNYLKQTNGYGAVFRIIPTKIKTLEELGVPSVIKTFGEMRGGIVLVTGPTGSGKSTTLAALMDYINVNFSRHIVTIEEPIEFVHNNKKSIITQREVPEHSISFPAGLKAALREDADIVLVGEMRDLETIESAVTAAETGHLVFGTLHTTGAVRTIDRLVDAFPTNQQEQVRAQLAVSMIACISQAIMPKVGGGLIAAFEIMVSTSAVENLIREAKTYQLNSVIQTGKKEGMVLLDDYLWDLWQAQKITRLDMFRKASNVKEVREKFEAFRKGKGKLWDDALVAEEEGRVGGAPPAAAAAAAISQRRAPS